MPRANPSRGPAYVRARIPHDASGFDAILFGFSDPVWSRASGAWLAGRAARLDDRSVWEQRAGVVEDHYAVAEQAPALFWMAGDHARGLAVGRVGGRAGR